MVLIAMLSVILVLVTLFIIGTGIHSLVQRRYESKVLTQEAPPAKEGEPQPDAPADQPVPRREAVEARRGALGWQAVSALLTAAIVAVAGAFGLKKLDDHRKAQSAKR